jgi:hypothetical protein
MFSAVACSDKTKGFEPFPLMILLLPVKLMNLFNYPHGKHISLQLPNIKRGFTLFLARKHRQLRILISITT